MSGGKSDPLAGEACLAAVHARFARAVILIYLGAAAVGVVLLVVALATDLSYQ